MLLGYARVSREDQSLDRQIDALLSAGVEPRYIYQEKATGARRSRPELDRLLDALRTGDTVIVSDMSRLSRGVKDLFSIFEQIESRGADIKSLKEAWIDTTTPQGKFLFTVVAGVSQLERDLISERTKEGLAAAKSRGHTGGRPSKIKQMLPAVRAMYKENPDLNSTDVMNVVSVSRSTAKRILRIVRGNEK